MDCSTKKCFIVTPIGNDSSEIRRAAEGVIDAVVIPVLQSLGFLETNISVAHRISNPGSINKQVIKRILEDDLVIANLTFLNPNVMYELAVRHAVRKPIVQICEEGTKLPFDIIEERTLFYSNDMLGVIQLQEKLISTVEEALNDDRPDNPIYRVIESNIIQASPNITDTEKFILSKLDKLETMISNTVSISKQPFFFNKHSYSITIESDDDISVQNFISDLTKELHKAGNGINAGAAVVSKGNRGLTFHLIVDGLSKPSIGFIEDTIEKVLKDKSLIISTIEMF
ncbi:hypothetical protein J53TS2_23680 [Paenibacillus sp. J53TS2]|uniref:hypothetical protein n=1 Tax=Paenibacillus sp. J53TS2 TaxID=2807197 RepID=UPI001B18A3E1|nr:hypothetical protein [Paenibacillus sp. J53TS2]GIP48777.1 hypothetical protein J53TS2_23680 [Paenibacillus sp. J53TS2]